MEVREFRRYSAELAIAWELVEHLSHPLEPMRIRRDGEKWEGAFGDREFISAPSAPVAICLAALHTRGVEVDLRFDFPASHAATGVANAEIKPPYSR